MKALLLAVLLSAVSFSAQAASEQFTFNDGGAFAFGSGGDSCTFVSVDVNIARSGTHNLSQSNALAEIDFQIFNFCTNTFVDEVGSTTSFQLVAPGNAKGLPKSVQASGTMTASCFSGCSGGTDALTFSLNLPVAGSMTLEQKSDTQTTSFGITIHDHSDNNIAFTTGTVSVTSAAFGALPISNWMTEVTDQKDHSVLISD